MRFPVGGCQGADRAWLVTAPHGAAFQVKESELKMSRSLSLAEYRESLRNRPLLEAEAGGDPLALFRRWFEEMQKAEIHEPTAMTLATTSVKGTPSARIVLLKEYGDEGFLFFTNYESRKGVELDRNPRAALLFYWRELGRQIRIEGGVTKTSVEKSYEYFATRPRESQIGAWASAQSEAVSSREEMDRIYAETEKRFEGQNPLPLPPFWGGYCVTPTSYEFWQQRLGRYHDRLLYTRENEGWRVTRLNP